MVGMPWPRILQAHAASPSLSALGMGHRRRSRGSVGEQWLGRDCCVTWGVPSSQLGLVQGLVFPMRLEAQALTAPFPQPPAGTQTPTAWLQP